MNALLWPLVLASVVASEDPRPKVERGAKLIPLVQISGSTAPAGELKVSPSVLFGLSQRLDLQFSPILKVATKEGSASLNLARPAEGGAWSAGGGVVLHVLHPVDGNLGDCGRNPSHPLCEVQLTAKRVCDAALDVRAEEVDGEQRFKCKKTPTNPNDKAYCEVRDKIKDGANVDLGVMCARARDEYEKALSDKSYQRRYPLAQIYAGALVGPRKYEYLQENAGAFSKVEEARLSTSLVLGLVSVTGVGVAKLPLTVELSAGYRSRATASKTPARWCEDKGSLPVDGGGTAAIQSCSDGVLGPPAQSKLLSATMLLGGTDIVEERWRFAAGPEVTHDLLTRRSGVALRVPMTFRLTPSTSGSGYLGEYKGAIRITPVLGMELDSDTRLVGSRVLLVLDLLGQQDLFGSPLAGL